MAHRLKLRSLTVRRRLQYHSEFVSWGLSKTRQMSPLKPKQHVCGHKQHACSHTRLAIASLALGLLAVCNPFLLSGCGKDERPPLYPMSVFFMNPDVIHYDLSPDGQRVAFLKQWEYRLNIFVQEIDSETDSNDARRVTSSTEQDITRYTWAASDKLIFLQVSRCSRTVWCRRVAAGRRGR